jgi:hypothetical protein
MRAFAAIFLLSIFCAADSAQARVRVVWHRYPVYRYHVSIRPPVHDPRIDPVMLRAARIADQHALPHSTKRCWRYVKIALVAAGAVDGYPRTNYARDAGEELVRRYGFVRLRVRSPFDAPLGSVLVYGGRGAGHVEIRTERGFASDYRGRRPCWFPFKGAYALISMPKLRMANAHAASPPAWG